MNSGIYQESTISPGPEPLVATERYGRWVLLLDAFALATFVAVWSIGLYTAWHKHLKFDDAFMFYRYALHVREGLGISWNLDGAHTYGCTSLLWIAVTLLLSFLPMAMSHALVLGSWLSAIGAVIALCWAVKRNAESMYLRSMWRVFPLVVLPLLLTQTFRENVYTGMETMLAVLLCGLYVGLTLAWQRGEVHAALAGLAGFLLFLTRPEAALPVVMLPVLMCAWLNRPGLRRELGVLLGVFAGGVLLELVACRLYFGTALPLSFYMKGKHAYEGWKGNTEQATSLRGMLASCRIYFAVLVVLTRRRDLRLLLCFGLPVLAMFGYLLTVTQIMGFFARYYAPYYAFLIVPALLVLDRRLQAGDWPVPKQWSATEWAWRGTAAAALCVISIGPILSPLCARADKILVGPPMVYDKAELHIAAKTPLPEIAGYSVFEEMGDVIAKPLPRGATIAASEVGYLGAIAPQVNVIDLVGLNDTQIALHGFSMTELLARKPDVIWMPHPDYTFQRGVMLSDPRLLAQYDVLAGAAILGLAVRKDSPLRPQIMEEMKVFWNRNYQEYPMNDYWVQSVEWSRVPHRMAGR